MTQEELDKLMNGGDLDEMDMDEMPANIEDVEEDLENVNYTVSAASGWPPPPPSRENKVVHQLDDVTKESEEKATQVFDILELISNDAMSGEEIMSDVVKTLTNAKELMQKLQTKFPQIAVFAEQGEALGGALGKSETSLEYFGSIGMNCLSIMDLMQYQDIHRQKIERVINIMRALSNYMNRLFEGRIDDDKRVGSAKHIHGDQTTDLAGEDDIEALIAAFGNK
ncbi:MAG: hypothetical protein RL154_907 [Pseudomonadota bacterium]|jgi:hypothetical protein